MDRIKTQHSEVQKLLDAYFEEAADLDDRTVQVIQGWLEEKLNSGETEAEVELKRIFDRIMSEKRAGIDGYARESLIRLHKELGFADRRIPSTTVPLTRRRYFRTALVGVAAAAAVVAAIVIPRFISTVPDSSAPTMVAVSAAPHEIREVTLPDGSTARLKNGTMITYPESFDKTRAISIDGEAFFTVTRDEEHPFTVEAGSVMVTVLGTEFNVKAWSEDVTSEVMLASGSVEVRAGENARRLIPGQLATINNATDAIEMAEVTQANILRVQGINLSFDDVTLDAALAMIADFYGVRMDVEGVIPEVDGIVVGMEDGASLEQTLDILMRTNPVFGYEIEGGTITITGK